MNEKRRLKEIRDHFVDEMPATWPEGYRDAVIDLLAHCDQQQGKYDTAIDTINGYRTRCDQLTERIKALERLNTALITAWDNWYDGPDTMIDEDLISAIIAVKDARAAANSGEQRKKKIAATRVDRDDLV